MHRGTLMVLKRILMAALGALGMGALAAGTALAQTAGDGNIPAPDIFDDQITCSMNVPSMSPTPTVVPKGGKTSPLDVLIGMGNVPLTGQDGVDDLGYVIPPMGGNCGLGGTDAFNAATVGMGPTTPGGDDATADYNPGEGDIATDVAHGYSDLLTKFVAVYGDPGGTTGGSARDLAAAQKALGDAIEAGRTGASLTSLETAVTRAQEAHNKAMGAFSDASAGPIYQAGVAEWMAKAAVTKSIGDYDKAVGAANMAKTALDELNYATYVPLGNGELTATVVTIADGMATVNLNQLIQYSNADLNTPQVATVTLDNPTTPVNEGGVTDSSQSNFDAAGRLIVPMSYQNTDNDPDTAEVLTTIKDSMTVAQVRTARTNTELAAAALEKLRDENLNPALTTVYSEAARRARAEADYYDGAYNAMLGDNTNLNSVTMDDVGTTDVDESKPFSIASRSGEFQTKENARFLAETDLRAAVLARETATAGLRGAFTTPQSFYEQLIARRQALKVTADRALAKASEDGATPSKTVTDNAAAAAKALADAEEAQATVAAAYGDEDGPTAALVAELLKTGGDDGQALVDAIAAVYNTATSAVSDAAEVVAELTGPDGQVTTNAADIVALDGRVTQNEGDIAALDGRVTQNETDIQTNTDAIAQEVTDRMDADIEIMGHVMDNAMDIETNRVAIGAMAGDIMTNTAGIATNRGMIDSNSQSIRTLRSGVAASMALAGMPEIGDRGVSVGGASYDGETALAVGVHFSGENSRFKLGLTSSGGETGFSVGAGWGF